jgi:hypothetical protein
MEPREPTHVFISAVKGDKTMDSAFKVYKHPGRDRAWFIAEAVSGTIVVDNCTSLDAAIQARQHLIERLESELRALRDPTEVGAASLQW